MPKTTKTSKTTKRKTSTARVQTVAEPALPRIVETTLPSEYNPISMWGYFGYEILFAIPVIGWIFCVCFAIGARNFNLRNFARSQFCWIIIYIILVVIFAATGLLSSLIAPFVD